MAIEWLSSGNRFLQACVAGVYYVCNRCAAGHDLGVLRGTTVVSGEDTVDGRNLATVRAVNPPAPPTFNIGAPPGPGPSKIKMKSVQDGVIPI